MNLKNGFKKLKEIIFASNDSPLQVAGGVALGVFVAWTPTVGIQMIVAAVLATLLRVSKGVSIALVWISNPYTMVPIYWFNYQVGFWMIGGESVDRTSLKELLVPAERGSTWEYLTHVYEKLWEIAGPLWLGSVVFGALLAIVCSVPVYRTLVRRKMNREEFDSL